jgi:IPT/TIG domain
MALYGPGQPMSNPDPPDLPEGYQPPLVAGGLFVDPNWTPRLADRLGSVRTDMGGVAEHWGRDIVPVMYPHLPNSFWIEAPATPPSITSISPTSGPATGGTVVTVTGVSLTNATGVNFGGVPGTAFSVDSDTQVTVTTPPGSGGVVNVTVVTPDGDVTLSSAFTYVLAPPSLTSVSPSSATTAGGTPVVITGTRLTGATFILFQANMATNMVVVNDTTINCTTPAGSAGPVQVTMSNPNGNANLPAGFTYVAPPPTVFSVTPSTGSEEGGDGVIITGTGFVGVNTTGVMFGPNPATGVIPDTPTQFTCLTPPGTGTVDVSVVASTGVGTLPGGFTYTASANHEVEVTGIVPATGSSAGGDTVVISGTNFYGDPPVAVVMFGGIAAMGVMISDNEHIVCTTPGGADGPVEVTVYGPQGSGSLADGFTYVTPSTNPATMQAASEGTTAAPATGQEPDMTEYEMDQLWGIEPAQGPTSEPASSS